MMSSKPSDSNVKLTWKDYMKAMGPGAIIAAAIIGPGSVTTASVQGATYEYQALWIIILSCIVAYFFQEPAVRITLTKNKTVLDGIREYYPWAAKFLYLAILTGGIAFQSGNFSGAGMALTYFFPNTSITFWAVTMSAAALIVAWFGVYKILENINQVLIIMMVVAFVITALFSGPDIGHLVTQGFSFKIPGNNYWLVLALLATTVPPNVIMALSYFLKKKHNSVCNEKTLKLALFDLRFSMIVTALITSAIVICAGTTIFPLGIEIKSAADMAQQLTPLLGRYAGVLFALGLWAAAFSSGLYHITLQPALFNIAFGYSEDVKALRSRILMLITSVTPVVIVAVFKAMPVSIILTAQAINGLALPLIVFFCWRLCNNKEFMGDKVNNARQNLIYGVIFVLTLILAVRVFLSMFKLI